MARRGERAEPPGTADPGAAVEAGRMVGIVDGGSIDQEMLRLVAELYYLRDRNQADIAELTGFSISKVSRLLSQARDKGIVRISIEGRSTEPSELAQQLGEVLGTAVRVTPGYDTRPLTAARLCGVAAAPIVASLLPSEGVVGLAGGYTIDALVSGMPRLELSSVVVVPLIGGWDVTSTYLDNNAIARRMATQIGAVARVLHTPAMVDSVATKELLLRESTIIPTTELWGRLDVAIFGMSGGPAQRPGYPTISDRLDEAARSRLLAKGAVGDVAGHLIRIDGSVVDDEWAHRIVSIPLDALRAVPLTIAVAAGSTKVDAVVGAGRSGLVRLIITDAPTARAALARIEAGAAVAGG